MNHWVELIEMLIGRVLQPYRSDDRLWHLWAEVDADVARPWTLEDLGRVACLSGEHLRRLTRKQFGRSPMEHVTWLRMRKAAALLASTPHKIETIGRAVGYENPFAFSTAFKRCTGKSPSEYRQSGTQLQTGNRALLPEKLMNRMSVIRRMGGPATRRETAYRQDLLAVVSPAQFRPPEPELRECSARWHRTHALPCEFGVKARCDPRPSMTSEHYGSTIAWLYPMIRVAAPVSFIALAHSSGS